MDPSQRPSAAQLNNRVDALCDGLMEDVAAFLASAQEVSGPSNSQTAQAELAMKQHSEATVRGVEELQLLCREIQLLWIFGSLDTVHQKTENHRSEKLMEAARKVQNLVRHAGITVEPAERTGKKEEEQTYYTFRALSEEM